MKKLIQRVLFFILLLLIPAVLTMWINGAEGEDKKEMGIQVTLTDGTQIDGEQFVIGMAASELSYIKEKEAQKAWMIVCRTNFRKAVVDIQKKEIKEKDLELDYISMEEIEKNNGKKAALERMYQLEQVSEETFGQVVYYGEELIDALYHQVSIGKTVSAKEIYEVDVPYLVSVDSSQDVESEEYMDVKVMTYKSCASKLKKKGWKETEKSCKEELKIKTQTENGYTKEVSTEDNQWTGEEWKELFGLNSTNFYLENYGGRLRIVTLGKGHGMGMSLYGANALAENNLSAETILSYYYPGTELRTLD